MSTIAFRTDASMQIGTGHVMRCLTLAAALASEGATCRFVSREQPGHLFETICRHGHQLIPLPPGDSAEVGGSEALPKHSCWLAAPWRDDARQTAAAIRQAPVDWLVVDHYALDYRWEHELRPHCGALMTIDDLADRVHASDLLLDQNLGRTPSDYADLVPPDCAVFAGPSYALLRSEFAALRDTALLRRRHGRIHQLLIALGGVDKDNVTSHVLTALPGCPVPEHCTVVVCVGAKSPWIAHVKQAAARLPWRSTVHVGAENMAQLMADSDLAIGAAGTMAWERCSVGLPTITVILADNQSAGAQALASAGASITLPVEVSPTALRDAMTQVMRPGMLERMQRAAAAVTDGAGITRVLTEMRRRRVYI